MKYFLPIVVSALLLFGCNADKFETDSKRDFNLPGLDKSLKTGVDTEIPVPDEFCNPDVVYDFVGDSDLSRGSISVNNDETYLYVTITTANGWYLNRTGLYVGALEAIPLDGNSEPDPYQFNVITQGYVGATVQSYAIALANLDPCFVISVAAKVYQANENGEMTNWEVAWTRDILFGTVFSYDSWGGGYAEYCLMDCEPDCYNEETAWSFGTSFNSLTGTTRWGWYSVYTLGQANSYTLYAGQTNNIGTLNVSDDGINITIEYHTTGGNLLGLTHLYVGTETDFLNYTNNKGTPVPGKFPYSETIDPYSNSSTFIIALEDVLTNNGQLIIAAHAESYLPCD